MRKSVISAQAVTRNLNLGTHVVHALRGVDLTIYANEMVSIIGPSGSGKSTLLGIIGGLDSPTDGTIEIDGIDITRMSEGQLTDIRNQKIGSAFQFFNLIPTLTALVNVALQFDFAQDPRHKRFNRARSRLAMVGLVYRLGHPSDDFGEVAGIKRDLPLMEIKPGVKIAILNILGDYEFVNAASAKLAQKLRGRSIEVLVTAEAKSIPLAHAISSEMRLPYVVLRKTHKPYMGDALQSETLSITTGQPQTLFLDEKDRRLVAGKRIAIIDDVISTGSTLQGIRLIMDKAGADVVAEAAIFTEGDRAQWYDIVALGHLPVWVEDQP